MGGNSFNQPESSQPSLGTIHEYPDTSRGATWDINGVTDAAWTDRDFGAYCPKGVRMLYLRYMLSWTGNGSYDYAQFVLRKNGSIETGLSELYRIADRLNNLANGIERQVWGYIWVECDEDGIIESYVYGNDAGSRGDATLYLQFMDWIM